MNKPAIIQRMAILWQQRHLISTLEKLEVERMDHYDGVLSSAHMENMQNIHLESEGDFWVPENRLIERLLSERGLNIRNRLEVLRIKRLLNACIKDGYLSSQKNPGFKGEQKEYDPDSSSPRKISMNPDKAPELQNNIYFWLKHIPEVFPDPAKIVVSVLAAIITAAITAALVLSGNSHDSQGYNGGNERTGQILQTPR